VKSKILWTTRTAVFVALLVTVQAVTAVLGNQLITGSLVNLILVISFLTCGLATGLTVAAVSPICAALVGIGPAFPPLIPFMALGNVAFIVAWFLLGLLNKAEDTSMQQRIFSYMIALVAAAIKFLTLYAGIVLFAVPYLLELNEGQREILSISFSYPQLITASIGGVIAVTLMPSLQRALASASKSAVTHL